MRTGLPSHEGSGLKFPEMICDSKQRESPLA